MKTAKNLLFIIGFLFGSSGVYSQSTSLSSKTDQSKQKDMVVDAGNDTAICCPEPYIDTLYLGGNPTADFGTPPYSYSWTGVKKVLSYTFNVTNTISDTTMANPYLTECADEKATYYVTVTDSLGITKTDSMVLRFSRFIYLTGGSILINLGDTATLYSLVSGGIAPLQYFWEPNINISDQYAENPLVWPDTTTTYYCTYTDSIGCIEIMDYTVYVNTEEIAEVDNERNLFLVFPNPANDILQIQVLNGFLENLEIYNQTGQLLRTIISGKKEDKIDISLFSPGTYFIRAIGKDEVWVEKFVVVRE
ncbi:MAG: T9SS type A sorting domain-containing protein [Bacteroidales bacterium]|nr:T9SS type A sorting domain-containing protein [Bacteroidales bacterium]MCF8456714.1 T9SS type A sorting domain-containing protein [Bacteroidales bacterium]